MLRPRLDSKLRSERHEPARAYAIVDETRVVGVSRITCVWYSAEEGDGQPILPHAEFINDTKRLMARYRDGAVLPCCGRVRVANKHVHGHPIAREADLEHLDLIRTDDGGLV